MSVSSTPTFAMVAKATAAGILTNMISVILLNNCHAMRHQSDGKHLHTLGTNIACDMSDVSGVRYESRVACVCFELHSNSNLCFSSFCSSVCTFADVSDPVNRCEWRKGRRSSRSCGPGCPGKSLGEGSASVFLQVRYVEQEHSLGTSLHTAHFGSRCSEEQAGKADNEHLNNFVGGADIDLMLKNGFLARSLIRRHLAHMLARTTCATRQRVCRNLYPI